MMDFCATLALFFWFPLEIFSPVSQHNDVIICVTITWIITSALNASSYLICAMGLERLYSVLRPINYREKINVSRNNKFSIICIFMACLTNTPNFIYISNDVGYCFAVRTDVNKQLALILALSLGVLNYFVPMILIISINGVLIAKLKSRQARNYR